jgi:beta-1,4-mannosyltransferase
MDSPARTQTAADSTATPSLADRPIRVLQSFGAARPTTNPYIVMLGDCIEAEPGLELVRFSFRTALTGAYDVFHVHWPEILVDGHSPAKKLARQLLVAAFVARMRLRRTPVVRTMHNLERPDGISRRESWLLDRIDAATTLRIRLNDVSPVGRGQEAVTIPHGHYRSWFARHAAASATAGRVGFVGLVRRYKGVEGLIEAFRATAGPELSLRVAGKPSTVELGESLQTLAAGDPRISFLLRFLDDAELVDEVTRSQLVVLPYRFMHNSGATLAALSLDRPVLVPDTEVNRLLGEEVGEGWVLRFEGELTSEHLREALAATTPDRLSGSPDLAARDWDKAGAAHADAYRRALGLVRRG